MTNQRRNYDWQEKSACRGMDIEIFFLPYNARNEEKRQRVEEAKKICRTCPVISECLEYALDIGEEYGVYGGMSEDERRVILRRRRSQQRLAN